MYLACLVVEVQAQRCWNPLYRLQGGDAVIIESHEQLLKLHTHSDHFALLREVIDSKPPITGEFMDRWVRCCMWWCCSSNAPHLAPQVAGDGG